MISFHGLFFLATPAYCLHVSNNSCFAFLFIYYHLPWYFPLHVIMLSVCNEKYVYIFNYLYDDQKKDLTYLRTEPILEATWNPL